MLNEDSSQHGSASGRFAVRGNISSPKTQRQPLFSHLSLLPSPGFSTSEHEEAELGGDGARVPAHATGDSTGRPCFCRALGTGAAPNPVTHRGSEALGAG